MKRVIFVIISLSAALMVAFVFVSLRPSAVERPPPGPQKLPVTVKAPDIKPSIVVLDTPAPEAAPVPAEAKPAAIASASDIQSPPPSVQPASAQVKSRKAPKPPKEPLKDPLARVALSMVGFDADAEEYWLMAINDPTITGEEKEDLIEDLNEEGFDDPKNVTADDIPLILSRLNIIEAYAPFAADELNARSFLEAYKDLWNMLAKASAR